jgi:putative nucleotidyltransferase with HDIG domain
VLAPFLTLLAAKSRETQTHSKRVAAHAFILAETIGLAEAELREIYLGAALHDVGKLFIKDDVLHKPGRLTTCELDTMREHSARGSNFLVACGFSSIVQGAARSHHERWDGGGYPDGLRGEQIPLAARIIAVVDAFDTVISNRVYDPPRRVEIAVNELKTHADAQFDPHLAETFATITSRRFRLESAGA